MPIVYRKGTLQDSKSVFLIFGICMDIIPSTEEEDTTAVENSWLAFRSMFDHLVRTYDNFWVAEQDGHVVGYARSIQRDDTQELTEFFVLPENQSSGIGRELLKRVFPNEDSRHRCIISTRDEHALIRYMRAGLYGRFSIRLFSCKPRNMKVETDLSIEEMKLTDDIVNALNTVDQKVIGFQREVDHEWLQTNRQGYVYQRKGQIVGYGYVGRNSGPFALLNPQDFPGVLAHAENLASEHWEQFLIFVPLINQWVIDYLLERRYQMGFEMVFMSDKVFGKFDRYVFTWIPFFI